MRAFVTLSSAPPNKLLMLPAAGFAMRVLVGLTLALACSSSASRAPHSPGGPYYFERTIHPFPSFYPTLPAGEISEREAKSRRAWIEAYFDDAGQISRMVKFTAGEPSFELRYFYAPSGDYEREELVPLDGDAVAR